MKKIASCFLILSPLILKSQCIPEDHLWVGLNEANNIRKSDPCYHPEGFAFSIAEPEAGLVPLYRFYQASTGYHFWTTNLQEGLKSNYKLEPGGGICGYVSQNPSFPGCKAVYRYSNNVDNHMYLFTKDDQDVIKSGYHYETIAFFAWDVYVKQVNLIRLYSGAKKPYTVSTDDDKWDFVNKNYNHQIPPPSPTPPPPAPEYKKAELFFKADGTSSNPQITTTTSKISINAYISPAGSPKIQFNGIQVKSSSGAVSVVGRAGRYDISLPPGTYTFYLLAQIVDHAGSIICEIQYQ